jgi:hypothetical protein
MTTKLDKTLKREIEIGARAYVVTLTPESLKLTLKGRRKGQELKWVDLVSGEAALAVALNASLQVVGADSVGEKRRESAPQSESVDEVRSAKQGTRARQVDQAKSTKQAASVKQPKSVKQAQSGKRVGKG